MRVDYCDWQGDHCSDPFRKGLFADLQLWSDDKGDLILHLRRKAPIKTNLLLRIDALDLEELYLLLKEAFDE